MARPSKLTPELRTQIVRDVSNGVTFRDAALSAGITETTFYNWMAKGKEAKKGELFEFLVSIRGAEAEARKKFTAVIAIAAKEGDWRAALEYLKRRDRATWGDNVDVTSGGEKMESAVINVYLPDNNRDNRNPPTD